MCAGFAQTYYELCTASDVNCRYVSGNVRGGRHAWNEIICPDGEIIPVDCTWKSSKTDVNVTYTFGKSDTFSFKHGNNEAYKPDISSINSNLQNIEKSMSSTTTGSLRNLYNYASSYDISDIPDIGNNREFIIAQDLQVVRDYVAKRYDTIVSDIVSQLNIYGGDGYGKQMIQTFINQGTTSNSYYDGLLKDIPIKCLKSLIRK